MHRCSLFISLVVFLSFQGLAAPVEPGGIPCRVRNGDNPELFIMTLGDVNTPLAQGVFYPEQDRVKLNNGTVIDHYYRDTLGIKYYKPINKTRFPTPVSGWCSWYYYFYEINEDEIKRNAQWLADNLKDYGLTYVQIDDGWEGAGRGFGENRDWTTINNRFPGGMDQLAAYIKSLGFKPGLWLAPHGQSSATVVKVHPNAFLLKPDGTSLSKTWEGNYLVDPSTAEGQAYLKSLFTTLVGWGYDYFKIDGQPCVLDEYRRLGGKMHQPSTNTVALYRQTLQTIHTAIGPQHYLLGCWEIPLEGVGLTEGWRTGADVVPGWTGFKIALDATMQHYFLHNIVWYCDPDTVMAHHPLTVEQARAWATLQGLTGQSLMCSDRMMDLSSQRVELYRRIFPAMDIRPLDLFPSSAHKPIWDLKVSHLGRNYDVVGLFNFEESNPRPLYLNWRELGLTNDPAVHVFDFWNQEYLGAFKSGYSTTVDPTSCKVLTLLPATSDIQLISTSRHLTQGWLDLLSLKSDARKRVFQGRSRVIRNDPYTLTFVYPPGANYAVTHAKAGSCPVNILNHQGWASVQITPAKTGEISWTVGFAPAPSYRYPAEQPGKLKAVPQAPNAARLEWHQTGLGAAEAYEVRLDGALLGGTREVFFPLRHLAPGRTYSVQVTSVSADGCSTSTNHPPSLSFSLDSLLQPALGTNHANQPNL